MGNLCAGQRKDFGSGKVGTSSGSLHTSSGGTTGERSDAMRSLSAGEAAAAAARARLAANPAAQLDAARGRYLKACEAYGVAPSDNYVAFSAEKLDDYASNVIPRTAATAGVKVA